MEELKHKTGQFAICKEWKQHASSCYRKINQPMPFCHVKTNQRARHVTKAVQTYLQHYLWLLQTGFPLQVKFPDLHGLQTWISMTYHGRKNKPPLFRTNKSQPQYFIPVSFQALLTSSQRFSVQNLKKSLHCLSIINRERKTLPGNYYILINAN